MVAHRFCYFCVYRVHTDRNVRVLYNAGHSHKRTTRQPNVWTRCCFLHTFDIFVLFWAALYSGKVGNPNLTDSLENYWSVLLVFFCFSFLRSPLLSNLFSFLFQTQAVHRESTRDPDVDWYS